MRRGVLCSAEVARGVTIGPAESAQRTGAFFPNLLFLYRKTVNILRNLAFGIRSTKKLGGTKRL